MSNYEDLKELIEILGKILPILDCMEEGTDREKVRDISNRVIGLIKVYLP